MSEYDQEPIPFWLVVVLLSLLVCAAALASLWGRA